MSEWPDTVLSDLRQATRFEREYGAEEVVFRNAPGEEKPAISVRHRSRTQADSHAPFLSIQARSQECLGCVIVHLDVIADSAAISLKSNFLLRVGLGGDLAV